MDKNVVRCSFVIAGKPTADQRGRTFQPKHPRTGKLLTRADGSPMVVNWKPNSPQSQSVAQYLRTIKPTTGPPLGPEWAIYLRIKYFRPIPKSAPKWWEKAAVAGKIRPLVVPDVDNMEKFIFDCITKAGWIRDDRQIVQVNHGKWWSHEPRTEVDFYACRQPQKKDDLA